MKTIDPIHKVEFSEEDVRAKYIDPSLRNSNWKDEQVIRDTFLQMDVLML